MLIYFAEKKHNQKKLDKLIDSFLINTKSFKISKSQLYSEILSALFYDMRKNRFTDNDIDDVLCYAIAPQETVINYVNNNNRQAWS